MFSVASIIDFMIDIVILGHTRFSHIEQLRSDICYAEIRGEATPIEKVCRDLFDQDNFAYFEEQGYEYVIKEVFNSRYPLNKKQVLHRILVEYLFFVK